MDARCRVPICIFSCLTLKRLKLSNVCVELVNAYVLPNVTSLDLQSVEFAPGNCSDCVVYLPMLEDLTFWECYDIFYFNIVVPKLDSLIIIPSDNFCHYFKKFGVLPPNLDLRSISSLDLNCTMGCFEFLKLNPEDFVLMEELSSVALTQKMLHTLKFSCFTGMRSEMQSIKVLLACFPGIEKVGIARKKDTTGLYQTAAVYSRLVGPNQ
nr:F-box/FBD/LRR-repeat protein At1g13570-like isoform X1 [Ipomoea batatas]